MTSCIEEVVIQCPQMPMDFTIVLWFVSSRTLHGDWYYSDGSRVESDAGGRTFRRNRGANEVATNAQPPVTNGNFTR